MAQVILKKVDEEHAIMDKGLWWDECRRIMEVKRKKRDEAVSSVADKGKRADPTHSLSSKRVLKLTANEELCAKANAEQTATKHRNVLKEIGTILTDRISTKTFDLKFSKIARRIMALAKEYKRIRWSLKAKFHKAAGDRLGMEVWHVERELCRQAHFGAKEPLDKLRRMR
jgi:hypothetical protein